MLSDDEKQVLKEEPVITITIDPSIEENERSLDAIRYLIEIRHPVYVLKRAGYEKFDDMLSQLRVNHMIEFCGDNDSEDYRNAESMMNSEIYKNEELKNRENVFYPLTRVPEMPRFRRLQY